VRGANHYGVEPDFNPFHRSTPIPFPLFSTRPPCLCGMEVGLPWTSVIDLLPMTQFVGPMLNGADVPLLTIFSLPCVHRTSLLPAGFIRRVARQGVSYFSSVFHPRRMTPSFAAYFHFTIAAAPQTTGPPSIASWHSGAPPSSLSPPSGRNYGNLFSLTLQYVHAATFQCRSPSWEKLMDET